MDKEEINKITIGDETIYVKKSRVFGWGIIKPNKNEDGSTNWFNLLIGGSWLRLIILILIIILILGIAKEYTNNLKTCQMALDYYNLHNNNFTLGW